MKFDVTLAVLIDNAASEYQNLTTKIMQDLGISAADVELALEKELLRLKNQKLKLYATAMYCDFQSRANERNNHGD